LVGCGSLVPNGDAVQLITGPPDASLGCFLDHASRRLVVDPK
jgi:hypothetical protein